MKMKKIIAAIIFLLFLFICISQINRRILKTQENSGEQEAVSKPFKIEVSNVSVTESTDLQLDEDLSAEGGNCRRLSLEVSIENISEETYQDVWFELALNQEVQPYIASGIITYTSEKMDVTTVQDAQEQEIKNGEPNVCGFTHIWDMLLTTEENLKEYSDLDPEGLEESLNTVTVTVFWDGGQQSETKDLSLEEKER